MSAFLILLNTGLGVSSLLLGIYDLAALNLTAALMLIIAWKSNEL